MICIQIIDVFFRDLGPKVDRGDPQAAKGPVVGRRMRALQGAHNTLYGDLLD